MNHQQFKHNLQSDTIQSIFIFFNIILDVKEKKN